MQSTRHKRSAIDGLSRPCVEHRTAESSRRISFMTHRAQHRGCLHYVSMMGDERASFERNHSSEQQVSSVSLRVKTHVDRNLISARRGSTSPQVQLYFSMCLVLQVLSGQQNLKYAPFLCYLEAARNEKQKLNMHLLYVFIAIFLHCHSQWL